MKASLKNTGCSSSLVKSSDHVVHICTTVSFKDVGGDNGDSAYTCAYTFVYIYAYVSKGIRRELNEPATARPPLSFMSLYLIIS